MQVLDDKNAGTFKFNIIFINLNETAQIVFILNQYIKMYNKANLNYNVCYKI